MVNYYLYRSYDCSHKSNGGPVFVVVRPRGDLAQVRSVRGLFITDKDLAAVCKDDGFIIDKDKIEGFEVEHKGKFHPFPA